MNYPLQNKNLLISIIIIIFFTIVIRGIILDNKRKLSAIETERNVLKEENRLVEQLGGVRSEQNLVLSKFFKNDPALFKRFVEDSAQLALLNIKNIQLSREEKDFFIIVRMNLEAELQYRNFLAFLKYIEKEEKNIIIETIRLQRMQRGLLGAQIGLKGFIVKN